MVFPLLLLFMLGCEPASDGEACVGEGAKQCLEDDTMLECLDGAWVEVKTWPDCGCIEGELVCQG